MGAENRTLSAAEAAELLGVKPATLYAYVSRGLVKRERAADGQSRFLVADLEAIGRRSRAAGRSAAELPVESGLTAIEDGRIYYRGVDALGLARTRSFEEVAHFLWVGTWPEAGDWTSEPSTTAMTAAVQAALPAESLPLDRLRVSAAALAAADPMRYGIREEAVVVTGRRLLVALAESLPRRLGDPPSPSLAGLLWAGLGAAAPAPGGLEIMNASLVLAADHELSTSTLTARLAASLRADPYSVVSVGLCALGGVMQPVASLAAESLLAQIDGPGQAAQVIGERLRQGQRIPGFGHGLHRAGDPRAALLLQLLAGAYGDAPRWPVVASVLGASRERGLPEANIDFALAALAHLAELRHGASEAIYALGRSAGWLAHAIEEYGHRSAIRPRAIYVGVPVGPER